MTTAFAIIRNGRLVDARRRLAEPADVIKDDTILSVGPSGLDAPMAPPSSTPPTAR